MAESPVSGQRGFGKNIDVLDSSDLNADRSKNTNGHSAALQTTSKGDSLAVAGKLPRGQTRIFITLPRKTAGMGEKHQINVLFAEIGDAESSVPILRHIFTQNYGQYYDSTKWRLQFGDPRKEECRALSLNRAHS